MDKLNYQDQFKKLLPIERHGIAFQLVSISGRTDWILLTKESFKELEKFLNNLEYLKRIQVI